MFSNNISISKLEKMDIGDINSCFLLVQLYIKEQIEDKLQRMVEINGAEEIPQEKSIFDDYDKENGYEELEDEKDEYEKRKEVIYYAFKFAIRELKNSYRDCMECDLAEMLDFICFEMEYKQENEEDILDNDIEEL
jgi:carboxypeptidase C (cathepsin A)